MTFYQNRVFHRPPGVEEEEITPPYKSRSFDSMSVAHILQAKLDPLATTPAPKSAESDLGTSPKSPESPSSPSMEAAAALLSAGTVRHQTSQGMDKAVDCLMLLGAAASSAAPCKPGKAPKPAAGGKRSAAQMGGSKADGAGPARRRLKMKAGGGAAAASGRQRLMAAQAAAAAAAAALAEPNMLQVPGITAPVSILSGASMLQLKMLSAAFKLCPSPNEAQILAVSRRVGVTPSKLGEWFQSRRTLQEWVQQQPQLSAADLARMFYPGAAEAAAPSPVPDGGVGAAAAQGACEPAAPPQHEASVAQLPVASASVQVQ